MLLLPEEEGTALGAPRGVSLCRDITIFAIVPYHTGQKEIPGNVALHWGHESARIAESPPAGGVGAHRPASTQKLPQPPQPVREEKRPADAGLFNEAQARRDDATLDDDELNINPPTPCQ